MDDRGLIDAVLRGDAPSVRAFVARISPVVLARVSRVLARRGRLAEGRREDLAQEAFVALFAHDARVLRTWDPARGMSLTNFVGMIAEREATSILRSGRKSAWNESPTEMEDLELIAGETDALEDQLSSREVLVEVLERMRERLSPQGLEIFQYLVVEEESVDVVCKRMGLSPEAIYQWKSRLTKLARKILVEVVSEPESGRRSPEEGQ